MYYDKLLGKNLVSVIQNRKVSAIEGVVKYYMYINSHLIGLLQVSVHCMAVSTIGRCPLRKIQLYYILLS